VSFGALGPFLWHDDPYGPSSLLFWKDLIEVPEFLGIDLVRRDEPNAAFVAERHIPSAAHIGARRLSAFGTHHRDRTAHMAAPRLFRLIVWFVLHGVSPNKKRLQVLPTWERIAASECFGQLVAYSVMKTSVSLAEPDFLFDVLSQKRQAVLDDQNDLAIT
jgi:hypothetical protein